MAVTKKDKENKRSRTKYPALEPGVNLRSRTELIDYDYIDKLSEKEKAWLNKFTSEYVHDVLDRKNLKRNLHNNKRLKKDCDDRNNARNRCIWTRQKAMGKHEYLEEITDLTTKHPEEDLNERIDMEMSKDYLDEYNKLNESATTVKKVLIRRRKD